MKHLQSKNEFHKMNESLDITDIMDLERKITRNIYQEDNSENLGSGYRDNHGHVIPVALVESKEFEIKDGGKTMDDESYFNAKVVLKPSISDDGTIRKAFEMYLFDDVEFEMEYLDYVLLNELNVSEEESNSLKESLSVWIIDTKEKLSKQFNEVLVGENLVE
jgi:hypothetical protein